MGSLYGLFRNIFLRPHNSSIVYNFTVFQCFLCAFCVSNEFFAAFPVWAIALRLSTINLYRLQPKTTQVFNSYLNACPFTKIIVCFADFVLSPSLEEKVALNFGGLFASLSDLVD